MFLFCFLINISLKTSFFKTGAGFSIIYGKILKFCLPYKKVLEISCSIFLVTLWIEYYEISTISGELSSKTNTWPISNIQWTNIPCIYIRVTHEWGLRLFLRAQIVWVMWPNMTIFWNFLVDGNIASGGGRFRFFGKIFILDKSPSPLIINFLCYSSIGPQWEAEFQPFISICITKCSLYNIFCFWVSNCPPILYKNRDFFQNTST